jgi:3-dehydroquinate dehydratase
VLPNLIFTAEVNNIDLVFLRMDQLQKEECRKDNYCKFKIEKAIEKEILFTNFALSLLI